MNAIIGRVVVFVDFILAIVSFVDVVDVTTRILSAIAAIILAVYGAIHYRAKTKLNRIETQIKEQELYNIMESNKQKHG